jgi:hypothetical protein
MTQHEHHGGKHEHGHEHGHQHARKNRPIHHNWWFWVAVIAMLGAMLAYVASDDERFDPGNDKHNPMPAAPAPAM